MSSMDSQFLCVGSLFTNDIVVPYFGGDRISDRARVVLGRVFVLGIALAAFAIGLAELGTVFSVGVWCFTGFAGLVPVAFAAVHWRRSNKHGAMAAIVAVAGLWLYFLDDAIGGGFLILGMLPVTLIFSVSVAVLVGVTLVTPPPDRETVEKFFGA